MTLTVLTAITTDTLTANHVSNEKNTQFVPHRLVI